MPIVPERRDVPHVEKSTTAEPQGQAAEPKWVCGNLACGRPCSVGPDQRGCCQATGRCTPSQVDGVWRCTRDEIDGGRCKKGPGSGGACCDMQLACKPVRSSRGKREILARWTAVAVLGLIVLAIAYAPDTRLFMPGPISTAHSSLRECTSCHTTIAEGRYGWLRALASYANPEKDSGACLTCHKIGTDTKHALSPHGVSPDWLQEVVSKRRKPARVVPEFPNLARMATKLFPLSDAPAGGVFCATCHKEHGGKPANLKTMSDGRCHACHTVKFDSFQGAHPEFANYPFKKRTRIAFDHAAHFGKHFPETRSKKPERTKALGTCAGCHTATKEKRHLGVKPFAQTCASCHLGQIVGREKATGPKGIPLLSVPGLDLKTLRERRADVGAWPELSEGQITPLMKLLLGGTDERHALLAIVSKLDLLDLRKASDEEIAAVVKIAWEIKRLIHALTTSKASKMMKRIGASAGTKLHQDLMSKLIATMPRDVLLSAQREWLPGLAAELKKRGEPGWVASFSGRPQVSKAATEKIAKTPSLRIADKAKAAPSDNLVKNPKYGRWIVNNFGDLVQEEDRSALAGGSVEGASKASPKSAGGAGQAPRVAKPAVVRTEPAIDAETWAEFGGWYRKDFSILYKPTGHADLFTKTWLDFSGHVLSGSDGNFATQVFELLAHKDAQGQCTKCHTVEMSKQRERVVNWRPSSVSDKRVRFTTFVHEPHFGLLSDRGCLTCHEMSAPKGSKAASQTLKSQEFVSNFKPVQKKLCAGCHKKTAARQDCLLCHTYHVAPIRTPMMSTKLPSK